jgi:hypothetical protein
LKGKLKDAELERDILKAIGIFPKRSMIYVFIKNNEKIFPIEKMCKVYKLVKGVIINESQLPNSLLTVTVA